MEKPLKFLFLAEFAAELECFLAYCKRENMDVSEFLIVSLQPEVKVFCKKRGLKHTDTMPFFDNDSHRGALIRSHELSTLIFNNLSFRFESSVNQLFMDTFLYYSRFYLNNFLWILEVMKGIKSKYGEAGIYVFKRDISLENCASKIDPFLSERDQFISSLVEKFCRQNLLKVKIVEENQSSVYESDKKERQRTVDILRKFSQRLYKRKLLRLSHFKTVFITTPFYNLDRLCKDIQTRFGNIIAVTNRPGAISTSGYIKLCLKELVGLLWKQVDHRDLMQIPVGLFHNDDKETSHRVLIDLKECFGKFARKFHSEFIYENCSLWDEFNQKVETDLLASLAELFEVAAAQKVFLGHLNPNLLISCVSLGEYQSWAQKAHSLEIPALVVPQKMLVAPTDTYAQVEEYYIGRAQVTESYKNVSSQSPLVTEYLKWAGYEGSILETGNLILSRITSEKRQESRYAFFEEIGVAKRIIVWAPSMKTRRSRRFYVLETWDELLSAMEDVFDIVAQMEDVHLIFRIHPSEAVTKQEIHSLFSIPENVTINDEGSFDDILSLADLLLSFSSTSIQESLMNYIPVILYDKWKRYNHLDAYKVKGGKPRSLSSVYYVNDKKSLRVSIEWILDKLTKDKIPRDVFRGFAFGEGKNENFFNYVGRCLKQKKKRNTARLKREKAYPFQPDTKIRNG